MSRLAMLSAADLGHHPACLPDRACRVTVAWPDPPAGRSHASSGVSNPGLDGTATSDSTPALSSWRRWLAPWRQRWLPAVPQRHVDLPASLRRDVGLPEAPPAHDGWRELQRWY